MARPVLTTKQVDGIASFLEESVYVDEYYVVKDEPGTVDSRNIPIPVPTRIERGKCLLVPQASITEGARLIAERLQWIDAQELLLPRETIMTANDRVLVNDREFEVGGTGRSGGLIPLSFAVVREYG